MPRRSPRALALWGAALVVAVATAAIVAGDLAALHRRAAGLGPEVDAVVATRDLAVGTVLAHADLGTRAVHRSQLPDPVVTDRAALVGRVVAVPVVKGAYVASRNVAPRRRTGLDGVVPRGMRAIRVVVTDALEPRAGAAVDVLATYDPAAATGRSGDTTDVVAAGVTVLRVDRRAGSGAGRAGAAGVTLLVDPDQARALADAQANGVVTLALVPPEDARHP
jgi:Flp pilus assembly protein CpaB